MSVEHTPGPWHIEHGSVFGVRNDIGRKGVLANTHGHFSNEVDCEPESQANAELIAKAPKLIALCRELIDTHDANEWGETTGSYPEPCEPLDEPGELGTVIDKIRKAVK